MISSQKITRQLLRKLIHLIGKPTINPTLFYSGKFSGYITWVILILVISDVKIIDEFSLGYSNELSHLFLLAGLFCIIVSLINLGKSIRLGLPEDQTELRVNGLYRFSRNPMYLGFDLLTLSSMILTFNLLIIALGIYSIIIYHRIILGEELFLEERFGEEYSNYKAKVRRYF